MSPFNDEEEIDGDELNLEPERVNALLDPGWFHCVYMAKSWIGACSGMLKVA